MKGPMLSLSPAICLSKARILKDWKVYRDETTPWTKENLRVYPTIGNH